MGFFSTANGMSDALLQRGGYGQTGEMGGRMIRTLTMMGCVGAAVFLIGGCATKESERSVLIGHARLTLLEAVGIAEKSIPDSHAVKAELTHANNAVVYEVQVIKKVSVDAETGRIVRSDESAPVILQLK